MKKKLSTLVLAIGLTATPVYAKNVLNKRANSKGKSDIHQNSKDKRSKNSFKRLLQLEAEKDFIKEAEKEVDKVINAQLETEKSNLENYKSIDRREIVYRDKMPTNNIELNFENY